ncbi:MAG: bifunctional homocysteine S-methyltransferase/methylenetetrahydrofolate reductase [candidate division Zixibacteria bacterium]|nr:bifunctional homocysteine S-methyltransferase/methylenetetrahydrofolate reductase [candidate division Zixibacteria bacterium]
MESPFLERLKKGPILCDGAMGTMLYQKGVSFERCFDELNLSLPELIGDIHRAYIKAGAEIVETNTFGANRYRLSAYGLEKQAVKINRQGVKLARDAREIEGKSVFVAGAVGPLGKPLYPIGKIREKEAFDAFREQTEGLLEGGVDLFIVETASDRREVEQAVFAIRSLSQLPIIAQMSFTEEGKTTTGVGPAEAAKFLSQLPVEVVGANCSVGPQGVLAVVSQMAHETKKFVSAQPNAGLPRLVSGRFVYSTPPEYFGEYARYFLAAGVSIIGGCCGTTPAHTEATAEALVHAAEKKVLPETVEVISFPSATLAAVPAEDEKRGVPFGRLTGLAAKLGKKFVISAELDPPRGINPEKLLRAAVRIKEAGVDCVNIGDSPMARVRMGCLSVAYMVHQQVGIDVVIHFTTRDRNLMGIQSDLLGAHALGIRNILAITGDPPTVGDYPHATGVFDIDSIGLIKVLAKLNTGVDWNGNSIGSPTEFFIGCGVNPTADDMVREVERFHQKLEAGAQFTFTQPLYDRRVLEEFLFRVKGIKIPILLGILPLQSSRHAEFLHNEVPGITIPEPARRAMREAKEKGPEVGIEMARAFLEEVKDLVAGTYLMPSFGRYEQVLEVVKNILPREEVLKTTR